MEVVSADGSAIQVKPGRTRELGRSNGLSSSDNTVSRRHVSFFMPQDTNNQEVLLRFEVLGRNPIYVSQDGKVKIFRRFERGEMENGDMFCVSAKKPVWYTLRKIENGGGSVRRNGIESELAENLESGVGSKCAEDFQQEGVDISDIDPVKEFGFLVIGHEFDSYPTKMIRDIKNWDWFLEEARKDSDDDDDDDSKGNKRKMSGKRKRKKGTENEDEEWTGESEDDKVLIDKSKKAQKAKYITRSKDHVKTNKVTSKSKSPIGNRKREVDDEDEEDDDEDADETLGGFIVCDENLEDEEEIEDEDEDDEEEFADVDEDE